MIRTAGERVYDGSNQVDEEDECSNFDVGLSARQDHMRRRDLTVFIFDKADSDDILSICDGISIDSDIQLMFRAVKIPIKPACEDPYFVRICSIFRQKVRKRYQDHFERRCS